MGADKISSLARKLRMKLKTSKNPHEQEFDKIGQPMRGYPYRHVINSLLEEYMKAYSAGLGKRASKAK